jgi:hypothetical protein
MDKALDLYSVFRGDKRLPVNVTLTTRFHDVDGKRRSFDQRIVPFRNFNRAIQRACDTVRAESLASPSMVFREVAAFLFIYADGTSQVESFTSNRLATVSHQQHVRALKKMRIFDELNAGLIPSEAIHIHSHAAPDYRHSAKNAVITINDSDFRYYCFTSSVLSYYAGKRIPLTGMVVPVGEHCGNVLMRTRVEPRKDMLAIAQATLFKFEH